MSETWYKVNLYGSTIEPVEVVHETEKTVTTSVKDWNGHMHTRRHGKSSEYRAYFKNREDAVAHIHGRLTRQIEQTRNMLQKYELELRYLK